MTSRHQSLQEIAANQKIGAQAQILQFSGEWNARIDQLFQEQLAQLTDRIEARVSIEMEEVTALASSKSRLAATEELNQLMRRLRQCQSTEEVATWLVDSTSSFCGQAALFEVVGARVRGVRARGFQTAGEFFEALEASLDEAPAFAHSVQERDTVVAIGSPAEVSPQVVETLEHAPGDRVYLFPLVIQEKVVALLYAMAGVRLTVDAAALELLAQAAAGAAQSLAPGEPAAVRSAPDSELIAIEGVDMRAHADGGNSTIIRRALEARARWFARAEAARLRLFHRAALERGKVQRNIYSALKLEIDAARRAYRQDFLAVSPTITDYLHRELLALAHDDASLLGPEYPGRLV